MIVIDVIKPFYYKIFKFIQELSIIVLQYCIYSYIKIISTIQIDHTQAINRTISILFYEKLLHINIEHTLNIIAHKIIIIGQLSSYYYISCHFMITGIILYLLFIKTNSSTYQYYRNFILIATNIALICFFIYPTAPPRFLSSYYDILEQLHINFYNSSSQYSNQYAALPSIHVIWAIWCYLVLQQIITNKYIKKLTIIYPLMTTLVIILTANHTIIDILAAILSIIISKKILNIILHKEYIYIN